MAYLWVGIAIVAAVVLRFALLSRVTIFDCQRGLKYSKGRLVKVLEAGQHWMLKHTSMVRLVDIRPRFVSLSGQELLTSDGVPVKVSLAARYEVVRPDQAVSRVADYEGAFYLVLQIGLREVVGSAPIDEVLEKRSEFGPRLTERVASSAEEIGLRLIGADIKDIMLPGETKRLFTQVVKARKDGLAALEKARGETAALRNLANAARLMEEHPSLLQLRALQQVADSSGHTLVFGLPLSAALLPVKAPAEGQRRPEEPQDLEP